jgi:serine/threonine protein kinase
MGEVYKVRDTRLGREVAIKVLPTEVASDPERLRRFGQEARAAAALKHPNILVLHDLGTHDGGPYIVTELLEGETLRQRLRGTRTVHGCEGNICPSCEARPALYLRIGGKGARMRRKGAAH